MEKLKLPTSAASCEGRFFGEGNDAGKNRRQQEKRETKYQMIDSIREAIGTSAQALSRVVRTGYGGRHSFTGWSGV